MGTISFYGAFFVALLLAVVTSGEPSPSARWSRVLTGNGIVYTDYTPESYTYYVNPYTAKYNYPYRYYYGRSAINNNAVSYPRYYASAPIKTYDDKVYITDRHGRTTITSSSNYYRAMSYTTSCGSELCGQNTDCQHLGDRAVCTCLPGHYGDPLIHCRKAECLANDDCPNHQACVDEKCVSPCQSFCGHGANCDVRNHLPVCTCPPGWTGNPAQSCRRFDPEELCHPSPCGPNTNCKVVGGVPTCTCQPGYFGSPLQGCRHECDTNGDCSTHLACIENRCQNPCSSQCGENALCDVVQNHAAVCKCPEGYFGNPYTGCRAECLTHSECPGNKPACYNFRCQNPCEGKCGIGANCELRGLTAVCSCPKDMTGDPFVRCRPFEPVDLCKPNPCGPNAICTPGHDKYGEERPVCTCPPGYHGNAIHSCIRGECEDDSQCSDHQACRDYNCVNPCIGHICGTNANCTPKRHIAVCTCPAGYSGNAASSCYETSRTGRYRHYYY